MHRNHVRIEKAQQEFYDRQAEEGEASYAYFMGVQASRWDDMLPGAEDRYILTRAEQANEARYANTPPDFDEGVWAGKGTGQQAEGPAQDIDDLPF